MLPSLDPEDLQAALGGHDSGASQRESAGLPSSVPGLLFGNPSRTLRVRVPKTCDCMRAQEQFWAQYLGPSASSFGYLVPLGQDRKYKVRRVSMPEVFFLVSGRYFLSGHLNPQSSYLKKEHLAHAILTVPTWEFQKMGSLHAASYHFGSMLSATDC